MELKELENVDRLYKEPSKEAGDVRFTVKDLSLENLEKLLTACGNIQEVSIGHALTVEALQFGFAETIRRYNELLDRVAAKPRVFPQE